jgi:hypothetical protein
MSASRLGPDAGTVYRREGWTLPQPFDGYIATPVPDRCARHNCGDIVGL